MMSKLMKGNLRVMTERVMRRGYEVSLANVMDNLKTTVRSQPGLISVETFTEADNPRKCIVFSEWKSRQDYDQWLNSDEFKEYARQIDQHLAVPGMKVRMYRQPNEDIFLL